jgi:hypothetical protein
MAPGGRADLYVSLDVEADGPIPGPYSMLSVGLCVAGRYDGTEYERRDPTAHTLYRELRPISDLFDADALEVAHLDRAVLELTGADPVTAMHDIAGWLAEVSGDDRAVICSWPAGFDWMFLYWYLCRFGPRSLRFSSSLDVKSFYVARARILYDDAGLDDLPEELRSGRPHTHHALDDAIRQAEIFSNIFSS